MFTRREITLLLFCLTVFILFYNTDSSVSLSSGPTPNNASATSLLDLDDLRVFRPDGRRTEKYVDNSELQIIGDWETDGLRQYYLGPYGTTARQAAKVWGAEVPVTKVLAHVPGFTVLDNVFIANATIFLVTDNHESLPMLESMFSSRTDHTQPPTVHDIQFLSTSEAKSRMGDSAARMPGVSWFCAGPAFLNDNYTLIALHRAYSTLSHGSSPLPPPERTIFVHTTYAQRPRLGFDWLVARTLFPSMGFFFSEDWEDLHGTQHPFFFDRVVLADRGAALRGAAAINFNSDRAPGAPSAVAAADQRLSFAPPFVLPAPVDWWASVRAGLLEHVAVADGPRARALTYVSTQHRTAGPWLRAADHDMLVRELRALGAVHGWEVHVVEVRGSAEEETPWTAQAMAAVTSSVMLGVCGDALTSSVFMKPNAPIPTVMEFFPEGSFSNENEFVARSLGMDYIAWWDAQKFARGSLPSISPIPDPEKQEITIDVKAVVKAVKEQMRRR